MNETSRLLIPSGIGPLDERVGGIEDGGNYLIVGAPGPEKMVAALQFLHEGIKAGEACALVTNTDPDGILGVAAAWGFDMWHAFETGLLRIVAFKEDFELRAIRSIAPEEVVEELDEILPDDIERLAVDPGSFFLSGGAKTLLGSTFMAWARRLDATVVTTFSVDGGAGALPSSADWLVHSTTGRLLLEKRPDGLYQVTVARSLPQAGQREETISLELKPGTGLIQPESYPARRGVDRGGIDENRLLLVSLGGDHADDLEAWATASFKTDVVTEPFEAVAKVQSGEKYGGVLIHTPRQRGREALQACRAIRPLTRAAIVLASDDAVRATDRIHVLEAGADDFLSGGIDFRELSLRIRQSIARGAKPIHEDEGEAPVSMVSGLIPEDSDGGRVSRDTFIAEILKRAANPDLAFFCILDVTSAKLPTTELEVALAAQIRADDGDIVAMNSERCAVLLQGAREGQLGPFLDRLRSRLDERPDAAGDAAVSVEVLSHPADADRIMARLESNGVQAD